MFAGATAYARTDLDDKAAYSRLKDELAGLDQEWGKPAVRVFYLATPPAVMQLIARQLHDIGLATDPGRERVVFEKPFGHDLESARELNSFLDGLFQES